MYMYVYFLVSIKIKQMLLFEDMHFVCCEAVFVLGLTSQSRMIQSYWDRVTAICVLTSTKGSKCVLLKDTTGTSGVRTTNLLIWSVL